MPPGRRCEARFTSTRLSRTEPSIASGSRSRRRSAGLHFAIFTDHGDGTQRPAAARIHPRRAVRRRRRSQHEPGPLRGARRGDGRRTGSAAMPTRWRRTSPGWAGSALPPIRSRHVRSLPGRTGTSRSTASNGSTPTANGATRATPPWRARCSGICRVRAEPWRRCSIVPTRRSRSSTSSRPGVTSSPSPATMRTGASARRTAHADGACSCRPMRRRFVRSRSTCR